MDFDNNLQQYDFSIVDTLSGWMKFMGIYTIVTGAISCLGIITAALGVPMIFAGIGLTKASDSMKSYKLNNSPYILNDIFTNMNKYFKIQAIIIIIGLIISVLSIAVAIMLSFAAISQFAR